jgi:hypothetical protein
VEEGGRTGPRRRGRWPRARPGGGRPSSSTDEGDRMPRRSQFASALPRKWDMSVEALTRSRRRRPPCQGAARPGSSSPTASPDDRDDPGPRQGALDEGNLTSTECSSAWASGRTRQPQPHRARSWSTSTVPSGVEPAVGPDREAFEGGAMRARR